MKTSRIALNVLSRVVWLAAALTCPSLSSAATLLVSNNNDNGVGSLRQAIQDNKTLGGSNTIVFSAVVTGAITLTTGELVISNTTVTIIGPSPDVLAVSGNYSSRVFVIEPYSTVSISGLSIINGSIAVGDGGGIASVDSSLTLSNCIISGNSCYDGSGSGVFIEGYDPTRYPIGTNRFINCIISSNRVSADFGGGNGGGIYISDAYLTAINCFLTGNHAIFGGGVFTARFNAGFNNCTFSDNTAVDGGGIYVNEFGNLGLTNCTAAQNHITGSGGAVFVLAENNNYGHATVIGSTIASNRIDSFQSYNSGGGISSYAGVFMANSIVAGNTAPSAPDCQGSFDSRYDLIGNTNGASGFNPNYGDLINVDPMLGPLQDNGGPTPTMAPLQGSPAIEKGKAVGLYTDQRGLPRPVDNPNVSNALYYGTAFDIGAVEVQPGSLVVLNTNDNGPGSLRQAIVDASADATALGYDIISFTPQVTGTIVLTNGELSISQGLTINGPGANVLAVSGNNASRVFHFAGGIVSISGLTIRDGQVVGATGRPGASGVGGGIHCEAVAVVTLTGCVVSNCSAVGGHGQNGLGTSNNGSSAGSGYGGGIFNLGQIALDHCWIVANATLGGSGGVGGLFSGFGGNGGSGIGGGIYSEFATLTLRACTVSSNRAVLGNGGFGQSGNGTNGTAAAAGLDIYAGTATLLNSTIAGNVVNGGGTGVAGGIYSSSGGVMLLSCTVAANNGESSGGGIGGFGGGRVA